MEEFLAELWNVRGQLAMDRPSTVRRSNRLFAVATRNFLSGSSRMVEVR
jgi:hypothetical protein